MSKRLVETKGEYARLWVLAEGTAREWWSIEYIGIFAHMRPTVGKKAYVHGLWNRLNIGKSSHQFPR